MELTRQQIKTLGHLMECFQRPMVQDADVRLPHDTPEGYALINIIPYYFLVDREGTVCHVSERSTPPPGYPDARRVA